MISNKLNFSKKVFLVLVAAFWSVLFFSCSSVPKVDPTILIVDDGLAIHIPEICRGEYESAGVIRVGVVDFANRSRATIPGTRARRDIEKLLPETVAEGVTDELVNIGGADVFTRAEMNKLLEEHSFQLSGVVNNETMSELGKMVGLNYLVTGSISDINVEISTKRRKIRDAAGRVRTRTVRQTRAAAEISIRMVDVLTGEVVLSQRVRGTNRTDGSGTTQTVSAIKGASSRALRHIRPEFSKYFSIKGYVLQARTSPDGKKRYAMINIGREQGMKEGDKLNIFAFQEIKDLFTGESVCDKIKLPVKGVVTNQIQQSTAWILLDGDISQAERVQSGTLVERAALKKPGLIDWKSVITIN